MSVSPLLLTVVEWATVIVTFVMMGSGLPVCVSMYKTRSVADVPYMLFLMFTFVSILGLHYAILITNSALILINGVSVIVWGAYVAVYIVVSKSKSTPMLKLSAVVALYAAHFQYLRMLTESDVVPTLGSYLLVWCTILCIMPADEIATMMKEKSSKCCNLPLLFGGTLNACVWFLYGFLMDDANIYFPNIPALVISGIKFILMLLYGLPPSSSSKQKAQ